ncbi:hypothetical protein [Zooshikella sp. RANM57]|uniref:hypothetical protein n=1 Tax=Zooshikella sp. RANM57 TaxID=3425863 RepID=UPI003D6DE8C5
MNKIEVDLMSAWEDGACHEYDMAFIRDLLKENQIYVKIFIDIFDTQEDKRDATFLIILDIIPYDKAIKYATDEEGWELTDFQDYEWFEERFKPVKRNEIDNWLLEKGHPLFD